MVAPLCTPIRARLPFRLITTPRLGSLTLGVTSLSAPCSNNVASFGLDDSNDHGQRRLLAIVNLWCLPRNAGGRRRGGRVKLES